MFSGNHVKQQATASVPYGTILSFAVTIYEKFKGSGYSKKELGQLLQIKNLYQQAFQNDPPLAWELDDRNRPTHRLSPNKWSEHVRQITKHKSHPGNYYYQSGLIAEYASTYLAARSKRFLGNGSRGDVLEQFLSEWIHFALNELPTIGYDEEGLAKIKQRLKYLEKVQKHETLFKFGSIYRKRNKFETFENIKQQLDGCLEFAAKEALRLCAREKLDLCRREAACILLGFAKTLYYGRALPVYHYPLDLVSFVLPACNADIQARNAPYHDVGETHTGRILKELIVLAGFSAFGGIGRLYCEAEFRAEYFVGGGEHRTKLTNWTDRSPDLPPWIPKAEARDHVISLILLTQQALKLAKLKGLVEEAYDLVGHMGDLWAYGDAEGKLSMDALMCMLEDELNDFYEVYKRLYQEQNNKRQAYNLRRRLNPDNKFNKNYNLLDEQEEDVTRFYQALKKGIKDIRERIENYSEKDVKRVYMQKKRFYQSVLGHLNKHHSQYLPKYAALTKICSQVPDAQEEAQEALAVILKDHSISYNRFPDYENQAKLRTPAYLQWKKAYVARHEEELVKLYKAKVAYKETLDTDASWGVMEGLAKTLEAQVAVVKENVEKERPEWRRNKDKCAAVETKGWPFNQAVHQHINAWLRDLDNLLDELWRGRKTQAGVATLGEEKAGPEKKEESSPLREEIQLSLFRFFKPAPRTQTQPPADDTPAFTYTKRYPWQ